MSLARMCAKDKLPTVLVQNNQEFMAADEKDFVTSYRMDSNPNYEEIVSILRSFGKRVQRQSVMAVPLSPSVHPVWYFLTSSQRRLSFVHRRQVILHPWSHHPTFRSGYSTPLSYVFDFLPWCVLLMEFLMNSEFIDSYLNTKDPFEEACDVSLRWISQPPRRTDRLLEEVNFIGKNIF